MVHREPRVGSAPKIMNIHDGTFRAAVGLAALALVLFPWPRRVASGSGLGEGWPGFVRSLYAVSRWRLVGAAVPGLVAALVFHGLAVHVRLALGRWPTFGENLSGWVDTHLNAVWWVMGSLWFGFVASPLLVLLGLAWPRARPLTGPCLVFGISLGLAYASMFLAPGPFLNWFFD